MQLSTCVLIISTFLSQQLHHLLSYQTITTHLQRMALKYPSAFSVGLKKLQLSIPLSSLDHHILLQDIQYMVEQSHTSHSSLHQVNAVYHHHTAFP